MSPELIAKIQQASTGVQSTSLALLVEEYITYSTNHCRPSTLPARISRIRTFSRIMTGAGISDISDINNSVLAIYFEEIGKNAKVTTINASKKTVKSFFTWVDGYKEIRSSVSVNSIKLAHEGKRTPRYLMYNQIEKVINSKNLPYVDCLLAAFGTLTGLRVGELSRVRMCDFTDDRLFVVGKGDNERTVTVPSVLKAMIDIYKQIAPYRVGEDDYLFQVYWRGEWKKMGVDTIWRHIKAAFLKVLNVDISPHWLRHSYAVYLLLQGCDIVTIQRSLGHTDIKITQRYLNVADKVVSDQIHKFLG